MDILDHPKKILYSEITDDIKVSVITDYCSEASNQAKNLYIWHYYIKIENFSDMAIQILGRRWLIFDHNGKLEEVRGSGLVGFQPTIKPSENFEYNSEVRLFTNSGAMMGEYFGIKVDNAEQLVLKIPAFSLDIDSYPYSPN